MGDSNAGQVELSCPGCQTTFHLRPRKSRMPRNPIPCPKCGTAIEMSDEQMARLKTIVGHTTPTAQVLKTKKSHPGKDDSLSDVQLAEMERLASALGADADKHPSGTLMGHPIAVGDNGFDRSSSDHKTRESNEDALEAAEALRERPRTSKIPSEEVERARASMREAHDGSKLHFSSFGSDAEDLESDTAESERDIHNATTVRPPGMPPAHSPLSEVTDDSRGAGSDERDQRDKKTSGKLPLSELLKKVRSKRTTEGLTVPKLDRSATASQADDSEPSHDLGPSTDDVFDDIVDDVVGTATERLTPVRADDPSGDVAEPSSTERSENSMLARLKKIPRSGLREKPGMAGERRGSGYIRLPESEILDLLGNGSYRLRVEDIVYEPIDQQAITNLIQVGKLKAKDEIAEADGDWQMLGTHPLFLKHGDSDLSPERVAERATESSTDGSSSAFGDTHPEPKRTGTGTKRMFPAAQKPGASADPPSTARDDSNPPPPLNEKSSNSSGEWLRSDLDSTFDNLVPPEGTGPHTPPPPETTTEDTADTDVEVPPIQAPGPSGRDEASTGEEPDGPDFPEDEPYTLDGPPSYPAIELPEAESAAEPVAESAAKDSPAIATTTDADPPTRSGSKFPLVAGGLVFLGIIAGGSYLFSTGAFDFPDRDDSPAVTETTPSDTSPSEAETTPEEPAEPVEPTRAEKLASAIETEDWAAALPLIEKLQRDQNSPELATQRAEALLQTGEFRAARFAVRDARMLIGADDAKLDDIWKRSLEQQATSPRKVLEIGSDWTDFEQLSARPPIYRVVDPDGHAWRFIPDQQGEVTWRAEIAFYQLCGVIECGFEVPRTVPASISSEDLKSLAGEVSIDEISIQDGRAVGALRRALEEDHVGWPIEDTSLWRRWLDADSDPAALQEPLSSALSDVDASQREALVDAAGDASTGEVAKQTANILGADYLVNNFARFAPRKENWGSTVRLAAGQLISVSNRAAFQPRTSTRVRGRFSWTTRLGERFVDSVRTLERDAIDPILFPDASGAERARLDVFWEQRDRLVERVDELIEREGKAAVHPF